MQLRLKYEPTPDNAPLFAADIATSTADITGTALDFSPGSLKVVDDIIDGFRREGCNSDQVAETLFGFGCYVGEVLVRNARGQWRNTGDTKMANLAGFPLVVELPNDAICNPIGKAFKRIENGEEDSLPYFYQVFAQARPEPANQSLQLTRGFWARLARFLRLR